MSSEAMHSLVDSANQLLLIIGLQTAAHAPDKQHQYGYGERVCGVGLERSFCAQGSYPPIHTRVQPLEVATQVGIVLGPR